MLSTSIKEQTFNNFEFMFNSMKHSNNVLGNASKMHDKFGAYYHSLAQDLQDKMLAIRLIEKRYVQKPHHPLESFIGFSAAILGASVPILGTMIHAGLHLSHYVVEAVHLLKDLMEVCEKGHELGEVFHLNHNKLANTQSINRCLKMIAKIFTYKFRNELLHLSTENCRQLSKRHFNQFISLYEEIQKNNASSLNNENIDFIQVFDPNPETEILQTIGEYVIQRYDRILRSNSFEREKFLADCICQVFDNKIDIDSLIVQLSSCTHFEDKTKFFGEKLHSIRMNSKLGIANPCFKSINIKNYDDFEFHANNSRVFKNPFWSKINFISDHTSMETVIKKMLLLLMKWKVSKETSDLSDIAQKKSIEIIGKLSLSVTEILLLNENLKLEHELVKSNVRISKLEEDVAYLKHRSEKKSVIEEKSERIRMNTSFFNRNNNSEKMDDIKYTDSIEMVNFCDSSEKSLKEIFINCNSENTNSNLIDKDFINDVQFEENTIDYEKSVLNRVNTFFFNGNYKIGKAKNIIIKDPFKMNDFTTHPDKTLMELLENCSIVELVNNSFCPKKSIQELSNVFIEFKKKCKDENFDCKDSILFWIGMLAFVSYQNEFNRVENKRAFEKFWKNNEIFSKLNKTNFFLIYDKEIELH